MKLRDLRSFVIQCFLRDGMEEHAIADFRASVKVMPYTIYIKLRLEELRPLRMNL